VRLAGLLHHGPRQHRLLIASRVSIRSVRLPREGVARSETAAVSLVDEFSRAIWSSSRGIPCSVPVPEVDDGQANAGSYFGLMALLAGVVR
jgi:hypothetical protein